MKVRSANHPRHAEGFSLIELITAGAVFLLLTVIMLQVVGQTSIFTESGNRMMDASRSARISLDTLAADLTTVVANYGTTILTVKDATTGNTSLAFLCASRADSVNSGQTLRMAGVFYAIEPRSDAMAGGNVPMLCRGFMSLNWSDNVRDALVAVFNASQVATPSVPADVLGESVFRMETVFVLTDGTVVATPPMLSGYGAAQALDLSKIKGLIVSVAALDKKTQKLLEGAIPSGMTALAAALPPVSKDGETPLDVWSAADLSTFPVPVRQNVRFFQRTIYLP